MRSYNVLLVEDDTAIGDIMQRILKREGYNVCWKTDGTTVLQEIREMDLIIMDVMLPGEDGYQLSKRIKQLGLQIPIIFLSARSDMDSKLQGLTIGEDYMVKPFDPRELLLRMKKMLDYHYGTFTQINHVYIDAERRRVFLMDLQHEVEFTAIERKIFFYLYDNRDRILTKDHFLEHLWQLEDRSPNIVIVHIKNIRAKIQDTEGEVIQNLYGEGYRLNTYKKK
ncbi:response regulator transcription factor [Paenibacillus sp. N1-5-1-14]|uniref:response regulator transcription factor n=1 Tax=Paenibacillus radicibacter TaxID=2972488 RepID=UPI002158F5EB|nr:response regulator transcription factor [Paenibacillus radicibacter]MCR8644923.1 response regulator transcription factor [Paenibacillus radicibacter]